MRRFDPAQTAAVGIAAVAAMLVAGGLTLSVVDALDSTGWLVVVLAAAGIAVVGASRDPGRLALPALLAMVALGLAIGSVALSRASAVDHARETRVSQLWLIERGADARAEIGVRNEEHARTAYMLRVSAPASVGGRPLLERALDLEPSEVFSEELAIPRTPRPERINAELFRLGEPRPYRSVHVWTSPGG